MAVQDVPHILDRIESAMNVLVGIDWDQAEQDVKTIVDLAGQHLPGTHRDLEAGLRAVRATREYVAEIYRIDEFASHVPHKE